MSEVNGHNKNGLPKGWEWMEVKDISESIQYGYTESSSKEAVGPKFLRITDIQNNQVQWDSVPYCSIDNNVKKKYLLKDGDLVFARTGATVGKSFLIKGNIPESVFASYLIRVRLKEKVLDKYVYNYFQSLHYWKQITEGQVGIGQPNVNGTRLGKLVVPIAPTNEQQKIVSKIEELFSELDKSIEQLKTAQKQLKVYRQSVLKWAFEGKLTNENGKDGELPKGWKFVTLQEICDPKRKCSYGVLVPGGHVDDGIRLVRVGDINDKGEVDGSSLKKIAPEIASKYKRTFLEGGEVLISLVGAIGRTAVAPISLKGANTARAIGVIPVAKEINSKFVEAMLRTPMKIDEHNQKAHEVARKTLNLEDVVSSKIPLALRSEQDLIVQEIESRFSVADKLEETITNSLQQAEALRQSILKKAFEGELLPKSK